MSDDVPGENSEYGNIKQIKADLFELKKAVADMEAKTEPLQNVTNALNEFRQRLDYIANDVVERVAGLEQRIAALVEKR